MIKVTIEEDGKKLDEIEGTFCMINMDVGNHNSRLFTHGESTKGDTVAMLISGTVRVFESVHKDCTGMFKDVCKSAFLDTIKQALYEEEEEKKEEHPQPASMMDALKNLFFK